MNVIRVNNATVRGHIEAYTLQYCFPSTVKFIDTPSGFITSIESLQNAKLNGSRKSLKQYIIDNGITVPDGINNFRDILEKYGTIIDYTPPVEELI